MQATSSSVKRPAATIHPSERRRALLISAYEGIAAQVHSAFTGLGIGGNAVTVGFALLLGADDFALGLVAAIPVVASCVQLFSARLNPRLSSRKPLVALTSTAARLLFPALAVLPFALGAGRTSLAFFLVIWASACALLAFSGNLWVSWMADLAPPSVRARYFSLRTALCTLAGMLASLAAGWLLDHRWDGGRREIGFAIVFVLAAVAGIACLLLLRAQPEPSRPAFVERRGESGLSAILITPILDATRTPALRGLIFFVGIFGFSNGFASPFWTPYQLEDLELSYTWVNGVLGVLQGAITVVVLPLWGRIAARFGHRAVVAICVSFICIHPLYYIVATPERTWPILVDAMSSGLSWSGYNLAIFNLVLALAAGPRMEQMFAVYAAVAGIAQATSAVLSGTLVSFLPAEIVVGPVVLNPRQLVFLCTFLARVACLAFFLRAVPDARPGRLRAVLVALPHFVKARMSEFKFIVRDR